MDNAEWKPNMQDMQEGAYPPKMKKSVAGQFAPQSSIGQKRIAGLKN
jgi:hypothetical protein